MKFLTVLVMAMSFSAFANHHDMMSEDMKKMPFDQQKKMMMEKLDMKSAMVEKCKTCVNNAKDKDALMACHEEMMNEKHEMKEGMHHKMKDMKKKM